MGIECGCNIDKCCHEKGLFEKYLKYYPTPMSMEDPNDIKKPLPSRFGNNNNISPNEYEICGKTDNFTPGMKVTNQDLQDLLKQATRPPKPPKPDNVLLMFPREDRDGDMGPIVACTIIFAIIATIGLLVFAYQYAK